MTMHRMLYGPLLAVLLLPACVVVPADSPDYGMAPALPATVELDLVPYFYGGFYYDYHHQDHRWRYSRDKTGPWKELPKERYPREIRYKDHDHDHDLDHDRDYRY